MFISRSQDSAGRRHFDVKLALFVVGLVALLLGIRFGSDWLIWIAIVFCGAAFIVRFVGRTKGADDADTRASAGD